MITIGQVTCRTEEGKAILEASVQIPREAQERWVAFSQECANYGDYSYITSDSYPDEKRIDGGVV